MIKSEGLTPAEKNPYRAVQLLAAIHAAESGPHAEMLRRCNDWQSGKLGEHLKVQDKAVLAFASFTELVRDILITYPCLFRAFIKEFKSLRAEENRELTRWKQEFVQ